MARDFTLDDFRRQVDQLQKLGMNDLLGRLPSMSGPNRLIAVRPLQLAQIAPFGYKFPTCTISFPRVRSQAPIMRTFLRGVRNSWPYRIRLFLSVAFAILAAVFWSLNFLAIHPAAGQIRGQRYWRR